MLKDIFTRQRHFLNYFFDQVNLEEAEKVLHVFIACKGTIVFTGVGKSGIIADKLSKTMISTGTKSIYLSPMNALHGDIGIVSEEDLVVIISKSGKSQEALELSKVLKRRNVKLMSWVSQKNSPLAHMSDFVMHLPMEGEICPFDLVPTTSTAVQLIFGDVMSIALMESKKFSLDQFALNHPAGAIGQLIFQRVEDVMIRGERLPFCPGKMNIKEALITLSEKRCGCVLVVDENLTLTGIFTDGDLRRVLEKHHEKALGLTLEEVMTSQFIFAEPKTLTSSALKMMQGKVTVLPVLDKNKVIGLVHMHHILGGSENNY